VKIAVKKEEPMKYLLDLQVFDDDMGSDLLFGGV